MSHIVNFCPLTKFDGGLLHLHEADEAAVDWLATWLLAHYNNNLRMLNPIQNHALRLCLGAFRTSPCSSLGVKKLLTLWSALASLQHFTANLLVVRNCNKLKCRV